MALNRSPALVAAGNFLFRHRNGVFPFVVLLLWLAFPSPATVADSAGGLVLLSAGVLLAFAGQALRAAVIGFAYIRRGGVNRNVYADDLVTAGLFALCRNPLYLGNLLIYSGLLLVQGNLWACALGGVFFALAYTAIVAAEETYLEAKFGEGYTRYCRDVPRWWPHWPRWREGMAGLEFRWTRVVAKDYGTAFAWLMAVLALLAYQAVHRLGWHGAADRLAVLLAVGLGVVALYGAARVAKKARKLRT